MAGEEAKTKSKGGRPKKFSEKSDKLVRFPLEGSS